MPKARVLLAQDSNGIYGAITLLDQELIKKHGKSDTLHIPYKNSIPGQYEALRSEAIDCVKKRYKLEESELEVT